jgi:hypothetical protein
MRRLRDWVVRHTVGQFGLLYVLALSLWALLEAIVIALD